MLFIFIRIRDNYIEYFMDRDGTFKTINDSIYNSSSCPLFPSLCKLREDCAGLEITHDSIENYKEFIFFVILMII